MSKSQYPPCLREALSGFNVKPTGNVEWDRAILDRCKRGQQSALSSFTKLSPVIDKIQREVAKANAVSYDLADPDNYKAHVELFIAIANNIVLAPQRRHFEIDDHNKQVLRFLMYYFNGCPLAEEVFPGRGYKLHKNILLQGGVGVGKTMLMQVFAEYLRRTGNPRAFFNVSVTQMVNYYTIHNNIDRFLYNEEGSTGFKINPVNLCLNDIGVENRPFYGIDTLTIVNDFLHARNEIWTTSDVDRKCAHLTTNLTIEQLKQLFEQKDGYGRIIDRFKTYNIIPITGQSRR
ncbi:hypothetical protein [uncultured Muribaculum sp.]|uniref:hypothetical protein n=1 Tax=uncultured Muribaculum sp. TaxID=1918613 RepID=UPI0025AF8ACB|nr:hypothetical protein [uncultured Muribaculum sp.]